MVAVVLVAWVSMSAAFGLTLGKIGRTSKALNPY